MKNNEPKLCPGCPLRRWLPQVKRDSWCNVPNDESAVQLCARLRALSQEDPSLPKCPHYPKNETLTAYF